MGRQWMTVVVVALVVAGCLSINTGRSNPRGGTIDVEIDTTEPAQVLRHVVMFQWKDGTPADKIREIENGFCALPSKIDAIYGFEWGTDISGGARTTGLTHCFVVTFLSQAGLDEYLPHAAHSAFRDLIGPHMEKVLVIDYWTKG